MFLFLELVDFFQPLFQKKQVSFRESAKVKIILPFFIYINNLYNDLANESNPSFHSVYANIKGLEMFLLKKISSNGMIEELKLPSDEEFNVYEEMEETLQIKEKKEEKEIKYCSFESKGINDIWTFLNMKFKERFSSLLNDHNVKMAAYLNPFTRQIIEPQHLEYCRKYLDS